MGRYLRLQSARPFHLLPILVALLAALGWTGFRRGRGAADAQAGLRPPVARPSPAVSPGSDPGVLCFHPGRIELGRLAPAEARELAVSWRLAGDATYRVLGVDATCGCVVARGLPPELAPSDAGTLTLSVHAPRRPGPFRAAVKVWLQPSPGVHPPTLEVCGYVLARVGARPARLDLGPRTAGTTTQRQLEVEVVPSLAAAPLTATLEGLGGSVAVEPSVFARRPGGTVRLGVRVPATPGPFRGRVVVRVEGEPGSVVVPVTGEALVRR